MSIKFTAYSAATGQVMYSGTTDSIAELASDDLLILDGSMFDGGWIDNGTHHQLPPQPTPHHIFNYTTKQWQHPRTLADLKATQWSQVKQARSNAEYAGFTWDGSTFDSDAISQQRITGAVTLAQLSTAFSIDWVLADNTTRTLNQADMLQVGVALGLHVATQFTHGVGLRAQIDFATTPEQLSAIVW